MLIESVDTGEEEPAEGQEQTWCRTRNTEDYAEK